MSATVARPLATSAGVFPGTDFPEALRGSRGELGAPHLTAFPLLDERGFAASRTARSITVLAELSADGQPFGWRLRHHESRESRAAASMLRSDINVLADVVGSAGAGHRGHTVVSLTGPLTLAAELKLANGESAISDHGARRDIAASLHEGLRDLVASLRTAVDGEELSIRWCEPRVGDAIGGTIPTSSGYRTLRSIPRAEVRDVLAELAECTRSSGVRSVLDMGGPLAAPDFGRGFDALTSRPVGRGAAEWESIAGAVDGGQEVVLGVSPVDAREGTVGVIRSFWSTWRDLGLGGAEAGNIRIEEDRDLGGVSPGHALRVLGRSAEIAEGLWDLARE